MHDFVEALNSGRILLMDGAMGTEIQRLTRAERCDGFAQLTLTDPELIRSIHRGYVDAGAEILLTNTFQAAPNQHAIWQAAIQLARDAQPRFVLVDVGPDEHMTDALAAAIWKACQDADGVLLETWSSPSALERYAQTRPSDRVPLLVSFTFARESPAHWQTFAGATPEECATAATRAGAVALGVNCGRELNILELGAILRQYRRTCPLPLFARPNAGTPVQSASGGWRYPRTAEKMACVLPVLLDEGVRMIGGCCGTTPEYVRAFRTVVTEWESAER